jgi:hypothetical protein
MGVRFPAGLGIFLIDTVSRPVLGPIQPPIQWVPGALSLGVKRPGVKLTTHLHLVPSSKECVELYLHSPIRLHGVVLSEAQEQLYLYLHLTLLTFSFLPCFLFTFLPPFFIYLHPSLSPFFSFYVFFPSIFLLPFVCFIYFCHYFPFNFFQCSFMCNKMR